MMKRALTQLGAIVTAVLFLASPLAAHPDHQIMGTVTMAAADHVMIKDKAGKEHTVKVLKTTKVTKNRKPMKAADIAAGTRVVATVVSDTDLTAKTIEVGGASAAAK